VRLTKNVSEEANMKWPMGRIKWSRDPEWWRSWLPIRLQQNMSKTAGDAVSNSHYSL